MIEFRQKLYVSISGMPVSHNYMLQYFHWNRKYVTNKLNWAEPHSSFPLILQTTLSLKIFQSGPQNFFGQKNHLGLKNVGTKKKLVKQIFWSEIFLVWKYFWSEKCWSRKNVGSQKYLGPKHFGSEKILCPKKGWVRNHFGSQNFLGPKTFGSGKCWVRKF